MNIMRNNTIEVDPSIPSIAGFIKHLNDDLFGTLKSRVPKWSGSLAIPQFDRFGNRPTFPPANSPTRSQRIIDAHE